MLTERQIGVTDFDKVIILCSNFSSLQYACHKCVTCIMVIVAKIANNTAHAESYFRIVHNCYDC